MTKVDFPPDAEISFETASKILGITRRRVSQLVEEGFIAKRSRGTTTIADAAQGYSRYWQEKAMAETKTSAESRVRDARAREIEMRNEERMRKLIPIEDHTAVVDYVVGAVHVAFNSIPARLTRDIEQRRKIEVEIDGAFKQIAKACRAGADVARKGGELPHSGEKV